MTAPTRLNQQCRIVVPAEVRRALGVSSGDQILFQLTDDGQVLVTSPTALRAAVWANNRGGHAGDSTSDIREQRRADQAADAASNREMEDTSADSGAALTTDDLLTRLV